jgi:hypothetical protein
MVYGVFVCTDPFPTRYTATHPYRKRSLQMDSLNAEHDELLDQEADLLTGEVARSESDPLEYVDVRGAYPVYINGLIAVRLEGKDRGISLEDAREVAQYLL